MIPAEKIEAIKAFVTANARRAGLGRLTDRQVADLFDVSRTIVYYVRTQKRKIKKPPVKQQPEITAAPPYICPMCGNRVTLSPCLICYLREREPVRRVTSETAQAPGPVGVDLEGPALERYAELKKYRDTCSNPDFSVLPDDHPIRLRMPPKPSGEQEANTAITEDDSGTDGREAEQKRKRDA